jgi:hypothetical protein
MPDGPERWRSNSRSKVAAPGALAASIAEGADATDQRVAALLGTGSASIRRTNRVTPDFSAARDKRRLAVRSSSGVLPQLSRMTAPPLCPAPPLRTASTPARSSAFASGFKTSRQSSGAPPRSAQPAPWITPLVCTARSVRSQVIGDAGTCAVIPIAKAATKPAAAAASPAAAAYTS